MRTSNMHETWFAAGVRTPFAKVDGPLGQFDAISLSVPIARRIIEQLKGAIGLRGLDHGRPEPDVEQHRA